MATTEQPWHDPNTLKHLYHHKGMSQDEIADELGCSSGTISQWMGRHDIDTRDPAEWLDDVDTVSNRSGERPWTDESTLYELYWNEGLPQPEIADELGCSTRTISTWMSNYDIPLRRSTNQLPAPRTLPESADEDAGYEVIRHSHNGESWSVRHHRLIAACEYGVDAIKDKIIHHESEIPWDNRPDNLEPMDNREHSLMHNQT